MKFPNQFRRVADNKIFNMTYVAFLDKRKVKIMSVNNIYEQDDVIWISDNFFVSGETGHTYISLDKTSVSA